MTPTEIRNTRDDRFQDLCKLAEQLGYKEVDVPQLFNPNGSCITSLINLLEDNPGATRAMIDWLADNHGEEETEDGCEDCQNGATECACQDEVGF
jgi:hypothetical protein